MFFETILKIKRLNLRIFNLLPVIITSMSTTILLVEDDPLLQEMMSLTLKKIGYAVRICGDARAALIQLQSKDFSLALLDIGLPGDINGLELLDMIKQRNPSLPVVMLTGNQDIETVIKAMQLGAYDYLSKPVDRDRLKVVITNALKTSLLEKEITRLKRVESGVFTFENLIGFETGLANVVRMGRRAAGADIPVLITGETGTGKEVFARAIHGESHRAGKPFVAVNCGAIPANLIESTLFGHEKGAFTGAVAKSIGKFREADGGTIFLDEIGDLPLEAQVKLLRVLQQKEITPVGADYSVPINVRVLSATHHDLEQDIVNGKFREDLFFRLNVLCIHMPALKDRADDIPALAQHFIERFAASENRSLKTLLPDAIDLLKSRAWPGNVRALENTIHRTMVMSDSAQLSATDFFAPLEKEKTSDFSITNTKGAPRLLADVERDALQHALQHYDGNVTQAAISLGLAKSTFYRKLKEYELAS